MERLGVTGRIAIKRKKKKKTRVSNVLAGTENQYFGIFVSFAVWLGKCVLQTLSTLIYWKLTLKTTEIAPVHYIGTISNIRHVFYLLVRYS